MFDSITQQPILIEGTGVYCPVCEGKGMIPTDKGRELLSFLEKFARPLLQDILYQISEEREK